MNTLNLAYPERGNVKFRKLSFPDGQQDIVIEDLEQIDDSDRVQIISRLNDFRDLELIICARAALEGLGMYDYHQLKIPYLLGARSDRKFVEGGTHYLRDVIAPIINGLEFSLVEILDPHSDVTEALIDNYEPLDLEPSFPAWVHGQLYDMNEEFEERFRIIAPDAGSLKKIYGVAKELGYEKDIIVARKHREVSTGKILSTHVPLEDSFGGAVFVIFDDICDGGRTFVEIAKPIKTRWPAARIFLAVTHGIFSAGWGDIRAYFTHTFVTNSVKDLEGVPMVTQLDVLT